MTGAASGPEWIKVRILQAAGASPNVSPNAVALVESLLAGPFQERLPIKRIDEIADALLAEAPSKPPE